MYVTRVGLFIFILSAVTMNETVQAQSAVPGRAASPPVTQPQDPGDEPLADICIVGGPPDSGFKLSVPATPQMLDASQTRARRRQLLPEDGIGIGVGPDGVVHIIHSYTVQLTSGYGPLVSWDVWVKLERNALGGPTLTSLTYQQQRVNERFNRTRDIQQRWENGIYWTGQGVQMLLGARYALAAPRAANAPPPTVPPLKSPTTMQPPPVSAPPRQIVWASRKDAGGTFPARKHRPTEQPPSEFYRVDPRDPLVIYERGGFIANGNHPSPLQRYYPGSRGLDRSGWVGVGDDAQHALSNWGKEGLWLYRMAVPTDTRVVRLKDALTRDDWQLISSWRPGRGGAPNPEFVHEKWRWVLDQRSWRAWHKIDRHHIVDAVQIGPHNQLLTETTFTF